MGEDGERRLSEIGERLVVEYITRRMRSPAASVLGIGDDAFAFRSEGVMVCCGDMLVKSTDAPPGMTPRQIGAKSVVSVISDLAAKGAAPLYIFVNLGLEPNMTWGEFLELWGGVEEASEEYGASIVGGDTNESPELTLSIFCIGVSERPIPRSGARPGDIVAVTGLFGRTYTGLHSIFNGIDDERWRPLRESVFSPRARLREGLAAASTGAVTAAVDSSDGLAYSLAELMRASGVGFRVERLPLDPLAAEYASEYGLDRLTAVMHGGEEYELVLTVPGGSFDLVSEALARVGGSLIPIGRATEGVGLVVVEDGEERSVEPLGWEHLRSSRQRGWG